MATNTFNGAAGTGNLATAGNWSLSHVPAAAEDIVIDRTAYDLYGDISANDINSLKLTRGWKGTAFGTTATEVKFKCTANSVDLGPSHRCSLMRIACAGTTAKLRITSTGSGQCFISSGTYTQIEGGELGGTIIIGSSPVVTTLYTINSSVKADANGTGFTTVYVEGMGTLETERNIATGHCGGGLIRLTQTAAVTSKLWIWAGELNLRSSGEVLEAEIATRASLTLAGAEKDVTVTALKTHAGASIERHGKGIKFTYTETPIGWTNT